MNKRVMLIALCLMLCAWPVLAEEAQVTSEPQATAEAQAAAEPQATAEPQTAAAGEADQQAGQTAALSENLYDFQMELCGDVITLPMKLSEFTALGWQADGDLSAVQLEPNQYSAVNRFTKDGAEVYISILNTSMEVKPATECMVGEISMDSYQAEKGGSIRLAKGIEFGVSSRKDVEAAYGSPSSVYEGEMYYQMSYEFDSYQDVVIQVDNETKVVSSIEMRNFVDPNPETAQASDEPPQSVKDYVAPTELGSDMLSFNVEYDGALYHMPAPLSAFEANGWAIKSGGDEVVPARGDTRLELIKNNQTLRVWLYNDSDSVAYAKNCFVTGVRAGVNDTDVSITLPGGLNRDSTLEEVEAAFAGLEFTKDESSDQYIYFEVGEPLQDVTVCVDNETGKVHSIEVEYMP